MLTHDLDGTGTGNDAGFGFAYNPASQITLRVLTNNAYEFPLSSSVKSYVTNGRNQYTQVGGATHIWDANGNLTDDGPTTFGYDTENRLVSASGPQNATLKYDPLGRLYEASTSSGVRRFVYDGDRLIAEYNSSGTLLRRYVHGAGIDEPLVWYEGAAVSATTRRYLHADHQGSIVAASNASGAMVFINTFDSYGIAGPSNTAVRFQYTGQAAIPELGLLYYKARFYNPALGRFMQTDPIGYEDDVNLYAYVYNDPLNRTDPTGTYGRGHGFTDEQWKKFNKAQTRAAERMESRATKMDATAAKLEAKGNTAQAASLRTGASNLRAGVSDLRGTSKLAQGLSTADYVARGNGQTGPGGAAAAAPNGNEMLVNLGNTKAWGSSNNTMVAWVVGHESLHSGAGLRDRAENGILSYGLSSDPAQKSTFESLRGTSEGMTRPDNLMDLVFPGFADRYVP